MPRRNLSLLSLAAAGMLLGGCGGEPRSGASAASVLLGSACREEPLAQARRFSIERCGPVTRLTVTEPWRGARDVMRYLLVPRSRPDLLARARRLARVPDVTVVAVPVRRIAALSTTYTGQLDLLGRTGDVVGIGNTGMVWTPSLRRRIDRGEVANLGKRGMQVSQRLESLMMLQPDIVLASGSGIPAYDRNDQLREAGLPVVVAAEWMEATPLGRAEWLRFVAAFTGDDTLAVRLYRDIAGRYDSVRRIAARFPDRPTVFCGSPWSGSWYQSGGKSYAATFLADAGADYLWKDVPGAGSVPVGVETVVLRAHAAEFWLNPVMAKSLKSLAMQDPRNRFFDALPRRRVYVNDRRQNKAGGNDFWESGISRPDRILADLLSILHPEQGDTSMFYYRHLGGRP